MKKVLVTGANGFVSYYAIQKLLALSYEVIATGIGSNRLPFSGDGFIYEEMDITDPISINKVMTQFRPEIILHTAAISKPDECEINHSLADKINIEGTVNLLNAAHNQSAFFIFLSTDFVFDGNKGMYKEEDSLVPVNYYGVTKQQAENAVKMYKGPWAIVRTVLVYGYSHSGRDNIVTSVAKALKRGDTLNIYNDQVRTPTYVEDLADGIITIIERQSTGIFHISGEDILTPYQIAKEVADYLQLDSLKINEVTRETFEQPALRPLKTGFNITKAKTELNYQPTSFNEGLHKTLKAFNSSSAH